MKPAILFLSILAVTSLSCNQKNRQSTEQEEFNPFIKPKWNEETFIKFNTKNVTDTALIHVSVYNSIPRFFKTYRVVIPKDSTYILPVKCTVFNRTHLIFRNSNIPIFSAPGDTLTINLDFNFENDLYNSISFSGNTKTINDYYLNRTKFFNYFDISIQGSNYNSESFTIYEASVKIDSMYDEELAYLLNYAKKSKIPDWFVEIEKQNILYGKSSFKMNAIFYRNFFNNETTGKNDKYFNYLEDIPIYDVKANKSVSYYNFLSAYFYLNNKLLNEQLDTEDNVTGFDRAFPLFLSELNDVTKQLDGQIREWFLASKFSDLYWGANREQIEKMDSLIASVKHYFNDTLLYNVVKTTEPRIHNNFGKQESNFLSNGEIAPDFYLGDVNGEFHSLKEFSGNIVFLNFWASWCAPCIKEIPNKNSMIKKFEGEDVVFINISLDKYRDDWLNAINHHGLLGLNLVCKGNWEEVLREKYYITGIPHYVLIDKEGKIVENKCSNHDWILEKIEELLIL